MIKIDLEILVIFVNILLKMEIKLVLSNCIYEMFFELVIMVNMCFLFCVLDFIVIRINYKNEFKIK